MPVPICCASASAAVRVLSEYQPLGEADRDDVGDLLSEQFVAAVAELLLGLKVEENDLAVLVDHDHRVRRRFEEAAVATLHLRQMFLCLLAHADVANCRGHQDALVVFQRAQHDLDGKRVAVLAPCRQFDSGADLLRQRLGRGARAVRDQPLGEADRDDVGDLLSEQFVARISELLFGLEIDEDDLAVLVDHDHRVRRRFEQPAVAAFHLRQMRFHLLTYAKIADCGRGPWQAVWHAASFGTHNSGLAAKWPGHTSKS